MNSRIPLSRITNTLLHRKGLALPYPLRHRHIVPRQSIYLLPRSLHANPAKYEAQGYYKQILADM